MIKDHDFETHSGDKIPWIIYGTAWKKEDTADLVVQAVKAGFRGIDTACQPRHYDESLVGEALVRLRQQGIDRESLYVQTKFTPLEGQDPGSVPYDKDASVSDQVYQSFETSLKNLRTTYIDTLILHSPLANYVLTIEAWQAMEDIAKSGRVKRLGLSNLYNFDLLEKLFSDAEVKPSIVQNRFYQEAGYDVITREWCLGQQVVYQSFWTLTANPHILSSEVMSTIAANHERTCPQILFRFLNQSGVSVLTGTQSKQHMVDDLSVHEFELSVEEIELIRLLLGVC